MWPGNSTDSTQLSIFGTSKSDLSIVGSKNTALWLTWAQSLQEEWMAISQWWVSRPCLEVIEKRAATQATCMVITPLLNHL